MSIRSHRDLIVWQQGVQLAVDAYRLTRRYPDFERFGLSGQTQRAATSVPVNIAEGRGRSSSKAFRNFLWIANGSLAEQDTHLEVALQLGYRSLRSRGDDWQNDGHRTHAHQAAAITREVEARDPGGGRVLA
jgi:four helix bundle protein